MWQNHLHAVPNRKKNSKTSDICRGSKVTVSRGDLSGGCIHWSSVWHKQTSKKQLHPFLHHHEISWHHRWVCECFELQTAPPHGHKNSFSDSIKNSESPSCIRADPTGSQSSGSSWSCWFWWSFPPTYPPGAFLQLQALPRHRDGVRVLSPDVPLSPRCCRLSQCMLEMSWVETALQWPGTPTPVVVECGDVGLGINITVWQTSSIFMKVCH